MYCTFVPDQISKKHLALIRSIHPDYTDEQLEEGYANLIRYFDLVWKFYEAMLKDGRLDKIEFGK